MSTSPSKGTHWLSYVSMDKSDLKALYTDGQDNRQNLCALQGLETIKTQARSVACLVETQYLTKKEDSYELQNVKTLNQRFGGGKPFDSTAQFREEPSPGFGTAFLVANKLVLTAGHCVCKRGTHDLDDTLIKTTRLVFNFCMATAAKHATITKSSVCKITKVVAFSKNNQEGDWALVELKNNPKGLTPLPIDFTNIVHDPISIYMLGHPSGLPLKYTTNGKVSENPAQRPSEFEAEIDAFAGNSGSPVFNASTHHVIGILVRGNDDYDKGAVSTQLHVVTAEEIQNYGYEKCQRTSALPDSVVSLIDPNQQQTRTKAITDCLKANRYVQDDQRADAIAMLKPLSNDGVQAANCALAALVTDAVKIDKYKKLALQSGFFSQERIGDVIQSVTIIQPIAETRGKKLKVDNNSTMQMIGMGTAHVNIEDATVTRGSSLQAIAGASQERASALLGKKKKK